MEVVNGCSKGSLLGIRRVHPNLVISTESAYEGEHRVTGSAVDQHVNIRQRELIFQACLVKIEEVVAASDLSILLLHKHDIREPGRMLYRLDETNAEELLDHLFVL